MTPNQIDAAIKFFASKLPEDQLAEFDALMEGDRPDQAPAMDAKRRDWLALDSATRHAIRASKRDRLAQDAIYRQTFDDRWPGVARIKI